MQHIALHRYVETLGNKATIYTWIIVVAVGYKTNKTWLHNEIFNLIIPDECILVPIHFDRYVASNSNLGANAIHSSFRISQIEALHLYQHTFPCNKKIPAMPHIIYVYIELLAIAFAGRWHPHQSPSILSRGHHIERLIQSDIFAAIPMREVAIKVYPGVVYTVSHCIWFNSVSFISCNVEQYRKANRSNMSISKIKIYPRTV